MEDNEEIKIGYARVSTVDKQENSLENQKQILKEYGCDFIYFEKSSGRNNDRTKFKQCINHCKKLSKTNKVTLVVTKSDRLSRSFTTLVQTISSLEEFQIAFKSLTESFDTSSIEGRLMFNILSSFAEYEVAQTRERIKMGIAKARSDGKQIGRKRDMEREHRIISMYMNRSNRIDFIARANSVTQRTVYNIAKRHGLTRKDNT